MKNVRFLFCVICIFLLSGPLMAQWPVFQLSELQNQSWYEDLLAGNGVVDAACIEEIWVGSYPPCSGQSNYAALHIAVSANCAPQEDVYIYEDGALFCGESGLSNSSSFDNCDWYRIYPIYPPGVFTDFLIADPPLLELEPGQSVDLLEALGGQEIAGYFSYMPDWIDLNPMDDNWMPPPQVHDPVYPVQLIFKQSGQMILNYPLSGLPPLSQSWDIQPGGIMYLSFATQYPEFCYYIEQYNELGCIEPQMSFPCGPVFNQDGVWIFEEPYMDAQYVALHDSPMDLPFSVIYGPAHGHIDGLMVYTPTPGYVGADSIGIVLYNPADLSETDTLVMQFMMLAAMGGACSYEELIAAPWIQDIMTNIESGVDFCHCEVAIYSRPFITGAGVDYYILVPENGNCDGASSLLYSCQGELLYSSLADMQTIQDIISACSFLYSPLLCENAVQSPEANHYFFDITVTADTAIQLPLSNSFPATHNGILGSWQYYGELIMTSYLPTTELFFVTLTEEGTLWYSHNGDPVTQGLYTIDEDGIFSGDGFNEISGVPLSSTNCISLSDCMAIADPLAIEGMAWVFQPATMPFLHIASPPAHGQASIEYAEGNNLLHYTPSPDFVSTDTALVVYCENYGLGICDTLHYVFHIAGSLCTEPTLIDPSYVCVALDEPVCGCDFITYPNACEAEHHYGILTYSQGPCWNALLPENNSFVDSLITFAQQGVICACYIGVYQYQDQYGLFVQGYGAEAGAGAFYNEQGDVICTYTGGNPPQECQGWQNAQPVDTLYTCQPLTQENFLAMDDYIALAFEPYCPLSNDLIPDSLLSTISLTWSETLEEEHYLWQNNCLVVSPDTEEFSDTLHYTITTPCGIMRSASVFISFYTGLAEDLTSSDMLLYPNPATSTLSLLMPVADTYTLRLYCADGSLLREARYEGELIKADIRDLPAGIYLLAVIHKDGSASYKRWVKAE